MRSFSVYCVPQTTLWYIHGDTRFIKDSPLIEITIFNYYIQSNPFIILDSRIIFDVTIGHHRIINGLDFVIS
jgi:hypothetical protein